MTWPWPWRTRVRHATPRRDLILPGVTMILHRHGGLPLDSARAVADALVDDALCDRVLNGDPISMTTVRADVLRHPVAYWWPWSETWRDA